MDAIFSFPLIFEMYSVSSISVESFIFFQRRCTIQIFGSYPLKFYFLLLLLNWIFFSLLIDPLQLSVSGYVISFYGKRNK